VDWDTYFINEAYLAALKSKDRSTQVGACIVGPDREIRSKGYNGPCRGMDDADEVLHAKPAKYFYAEHAERNAIYNAARIGVSCKGCTLYVTNECCADCARGIVQAGIAEVVIHAECPPMTGWRESQDAALDIFRRCGVRVRQWSCVPVFPEIRHGGNIVRIDGSSTA
jgi:dCMP deaminase